ncbi:TIGR03364 family FAD-dependent oxidoreductase [Corynebacterium lowii]|uniref:D-amino acid dehydrogenase small subunit n=1 Tax=Corynebacterium lowii TaxID=1544413 RepID=A0A0Q0UKR8_9CORY|nr:TIGR03364 family FAD-dependent oxidoreductase [Corynebacterium lowii]KQB86879.1 D-amino acid dehydrogenase small subunit [Corynebacterium lowii]MDP9851567.1 FAD dependent oxidoreductase TIGR03364 [Corynebacterium lowii]
MSTQHSTDLIVIGAGILGLATAWRAHKQGRTVHVIERSDSPVGASIQNFGHACFTAQADDLQDLARSSAQGWKEAARDAGLWAMQPGTVIPLQTETEKAVIEQFRAHRGGEDVVLLSPQATRERLGAPALDVLGGAHLPRDMRVNPRQAAPELAWWLHNQGVRFSWNTAAWHTAGGVVETNRGTFRASEVVACPGERAGEMFPGVVDKHGVRTCTLTMALIARPETTPVDLAMLTATSMTRYEGIAAMPAAERLRAELAAREPELVDNIANVMATAIPGGILVGDSHEYALSPTPFIDAAQSELLLGRAARYLGIECPVVLQRWQGRYADSASTNLVLEHPDEATTVAVVTSGIGMTLSFGIAELIVNHEEAPAP